MSMTMARPLVPVPSRLRFIDNLRWVMIALVVTIHAAVTYSGVGSWYYKEPSKPGDFSLLAFVLYETHIQAFFMGLLFLVAGYFVPASLDRKGPRRFLRDRLVRLGLPTALYALAVHPLINYCLLRSQRGDSGASTFELYGRYLLGLGFLWGTGPLWFALALLVMTALYTVVRLFSPRPASPPAAASLPGHAGVGLLIAVIFVSSFLVRIVQPIGTDVLNMQLCFFPQYIALFLVGIVAYRRDWLLRVPQEFGRFWGRLALTVGPVLWLIMFVGGGALSGDFSRHVGGLHWQSAAYCFWESFFGVSACLGLLVFFRARFDQQPSPARFLSDNAFGVYVFHAPILIAISLSFRDLALAPLAKFLLLSVASLVATFLASHYLLRRVPGLRHIL